MKKQIRYYEGVTNKQISLMFKLADEKKLYGMVEKVTGIPFVTALGKNQSSFIIDRLLDKKTIPLRPYPPRPEHRIRKAGIDPANLPTASQISGITNTIKELMQWRNVSKEQIQAYIQKYGKVKSIRDLSRTQARNLHVALLKIQKSKI